MNKTISYPMTNRALYKALTQHPKQSISLRSYLSELATGLLAFSGESHMETTDFAALLCGSLQTDRKRSEPTADFMVLQQQLQTQIEDLQWFEDQGTLSSPHRYFGLDVPAGRRWYNFEVADYLEAAAMGTFGGWVPGDGGRQLVPGDVAVLDAQGNLTSVPASELPHPVEAIDYIDWPTLTEFVDCGRSYE